MQADIKGTTLPVLEITLESGEEVVTIHGELSWMTPNVQLSQTAGGGGPGGPPGLGGGGLSGSRSGPGRLDQAVNRKYTLNFTVWATNILNHENLGTPNGGLLSPYFGKSQSLAGGFFGSQSGGNRTINLQASFSF